MAIYFSSLPLALGGLLIAGIPDLTALPVILLSAMLQTGYSISLFKAYDRGPLSSVYPVARGSAPIFIFGLSYIFFDPIISTETLANSILVPIIMEPFVQFRFRQTLLRNILEDRVAQEGQCNLAVVVLYQAAAFDHEKPPPSQNG